MRSLRPVFLSFLFVLVCVPALAETIYIPPVIIEGLHHTVLYDNFINRDGTVRDAVTFPSGPGTFSGPGFTASIRTGDIVVVRFEAPAGQQFSVTGHPNATSNYFFLSAEWFTGTGDWGSYASPGTVTFENLIGTAPTETWKQFMVSDNGQSLRVDCQFRVSGEFTFKAIEIRLEVTQPLMKQWRVYGGVDSSSAPSFGATSVRYGGPLDDRTIMAIEPLTVQIPPVEIAELHHTHLFNSYDNRGTLRDAVTFPSGPGSFSGPGFTAPISDGTEIRVRFEAPAGKQFVVYRHPDATSSYFFLNALWHTGLSDSGSYSSDGTVTFENLKGAAPTESWKQFMVSNNGQSIKTDCSFTVNGTFFFTAVEIIFTVSQPLAELARTYGAVNSYSAPSFGSTAIRYGGPLTDRTVMSIVPIGPTDCAEVVGQGFQLLQDLSGDCRVDMEDFAMFVSGWLQCNDPQDPACTANWP